MREMRPREILSCVKDLLSDPDRWLKGHMAVNDDGYRVDPKSEDACRWCLAGAALRCDPAYVPRGGIAMFAQVDERVWKALDETKPDKMFSPVVNNDGALDHAGLMSWLERAIEAADGPVRRQA